MKLSKSVILTEKKITKIHINLEATGEYELKCKYY
jgi:hypothetical protein